MNHSKRISNWCWQVGLDALVKSGCSDPDVRLFLGVIEQDPDAVRSALAAGANINTTRGQLLQRHARSFLEPAVRERIATAVLAGSLFGLGGGQDDDAQVVAERDAYLKSLYALTRNDFPFDEKTLPVADEGPTLGNLIEELTRAG